MAEDLVQSFEIVLGVLRVDQDVPTLLRVNARDTVAKRVDALVEFRRIGRRAYRRLL